jgi:hypothetical protein
MNRRNFIIKTILISSGVGIAYYGSKYFKSHAVPLYSKLDSNYELISILTELIIPSTDSPGAKEAKAADFICNFLKNSEFSTTNNFIEGLDILVKKAENKYHISFCKLEKEKQIELLNEFKKTETFIPYLDKINEKVFGKDFFQTLKSLTSIAFCTSKEALSSSLNYNRTPGKYISTRITKSSKSWATK